MSAADNVAFPLLGKVKRGAIHVQLMAIRFAKIITSSSLKSDISLLILLTLSSSS